ncbi:MAG: cation diffusion facilitator family transporter [Actinomycetes bacterium]
MTSVREERSGEPERGGPGRADDEPGEEGGRRSESAGTVLIAGGANLVLAVAKAVAGVMSGSSALLAESAHSLADTMNELFLLTALRRSERPADHRHHFGYGKERYFWALLAAVGIFVLGGGFAIRQGVEAILDGSGAPGGFLVAYVVLGVAFVAEGASLLKAIRQIRREAAAGRRGPVEHVVTTPDPTVKTVAFEDSAALAGVVLATAGVGLHQLTGSAVWDGAASVAIGVLLIGVAYVLGRDNMARLVGTSAGPEVHEAIRQEIESFDEVDRVVELLTMRLGPDEVIAAAKVDLADGIDGDDVEQVSDEIDRRLAERVPQAKHVFLDPTARNEPGDDEDGTR